MKNYLHTSIIIPALFLSLIIIISITFLLKNNTSVKSPHTAVLSTEATTIKKKCADPTVVEKFSKEWYKLGCYAKQMENISFQNGNDYAYRVLRLLQEEDPEAKNCHIIGHGIGWGVYKQDPSKWRTAIKNSKATCGYGEQMGIIEKHAQTIGGGKLDELDIPSLCGPNPQVDCNHAVGHIALVLTENDLQKATQLCSSLEKNQISTCLDGMMMERLIGENLREHGIIPHPGENWFDKLPEHKQFCMQFTGQLLLSCWQEIAHPAYYYFNKNAQEIFAFCKEAPSAEAAAECMKHALPLIAGGLNYDLKALKNTCAIGRSFDESFEKDCYRILVSIRLNHSRLEHPDSLMEFCLQAPQDLRAFCLGSIRATLTRLNTPRNQIESFCSKGPTEYRKVCTSPGN